MPYSIGPTIGVKGEKAFRAAFQELISVSKRFDAEMEQLTATFSKNDTAIDRSAKKQQVLTNAIQAQYDLVAKSHQQIAMALDAEDKRTQAYEKTLQKVRDLTEVHKEHENTLKQLESQYGENEECVKLYRKEFAEEEKALDKANKQLTENEAKMHRSRSAVQQWQTTLTQAESRIEELQKELAKAPNHVEEFTRRTEESRKSLERMEKQVQILDAEMARNESTYDKWTSAVRKSADASEVLKQKIDQERKILIENTHLKDEAVRTEEKQRKEYEKLVQKLEEAKKAYGEDSHEVRILSSAVEDQARLVDEAAKNTATYTQRVIESETAINNFHRQLRENAPLKAWGEELQNIGGKMEEFGNAMSTYITAPLAALSGYAIQAAADFQDGMAKIYTIAIDGAEPMEKMHNELVQLSNETGFDLKDLAEATYQTVSASVDATKAVEFMTDATKLARAGFTTTTKAVDVLTTIINSYQMKAEDAAYISDVLLKTQNDGKLIIDELASSLGIIIPMASNYNVGLEQIAAAYATMTKQGVPAQKATTFLRAVFTELEKESSTVAKILDDKTGKSFAQLMGEGKSLASVLKILYKEAHEDTEKFQRLFGNVRATQAVAALVTGDFSILNKELKRMKNAAGQAEKALEVMETPALKAKRAVNQLKNSAENLGETMIDQLLPSFLDATSSVKDMTDSFIALTPESKKLITKAIALSAAIGPVATITGKLVGYVGALMAGTASIVPLLGAAAVGLIGMYTAAMVAAEEDEALRQSEYGLSEEIKNTIEQVYALKQAHEDSVIAMQEENTHITTNANYAQKLAEQYDNLITKKGKVKKGSEELAEELIGELAQALNLSKEDVRALIDEHGKLSQSIHQTIEDYKAEAMATVMKQELLEATQRLVEAQENERVLIEQQDIAYKTLRDTQHEMQVAQDAITDAENRGLPVTEKMYQALDEATNNYSVAATAVNELDQALSDSRAFVKDAQDDIDRITEALTGVQGESDKTAEKVKEDSKKAKEAVESAAEDTKKALSNAAKEAYKHGENLARGFAQGIDDYAYLGSNAASAMGANSAKLLKNTLHEKSPSKLTAEIGRYFVEGFANPIKEGISEMGYLATRLGESAAGGLSMGSYLPEGNVVNNKTITAPISINMAINGNVDDPDGFARDIASQLTDLINRERSVFA